MWVSAEPEAQLVRTGVDRKHSAKPFRNKLISVAGVKIHSTRFNREFWQAVLKNAAIGDDMLTASQFDALFLLGSAERMCVKTMTRLFICNWLQIGPSFPRGSMDCDGNCSADM